MTELLGEAYHEHIRIYHSVDEGSLGVRRFVATFTNDSNNTSFFFFTIQSPDNKLKIKSH